MDACWLEQPGNAALADDGTECCWCDFLGMLAELERSSAQVSVACYEMKSGQTGLEDQAMFVQQ